MNHVISLTYDYQLKRETYNVALISFAREITDFCRDIEAEPISISHSHNFERKIIEAMIVVKYLDECEDEE